MRPSSHFKAAFKMQIVRARCGDWCERLHSTSAPVTYPISDPVIGRLLTSSRAQLVPAHLLRCRLAQFGVIKTTTCHNRGRSLGRERSPRWSLHFAPGGSYRENWRVEKGLGSKAGEIRPQRTAGFCYTGACYSSSANPGGRQWWGRLRCRSWSLTPA